MSLRPPELDIAPSGPFTESKLARDSQVNPLKMLILGILSLFLGIAAAPALICVIFPLVSTAEFGDTIPIDSGGAFVMSSMLFVAFYKLLDAGWVWLRGRFQALSACLFWMLVGVFTMCGATWLVSSFCDDSQTDTAKPSTVGESSSGEGYVGAGGEH